MISESQFVVWVIVICCFLYCLHLCRQFWENIIRNKLFYKNLMTNLEVYKMGKSDEDIYQMFHGLKSVKRDYKKQGQSVLYYIDPRYDDN